MDLNVIHNIECIKGMRQKVPGSSIDLVITSPPYNCGIKYDSWDDNMSWGRYILWCTEWMSEISRVLKDDGRFCINVLIDIGNSKMGRFSPFAEFYSIIEDLGLGFDGVALWTDNHRVKYTAWGSWMSPSAPYIYCPYEVIIIGHKKQWKKSKKGESTISKEEFMTGCSGIWNLPTESNKKYTAAFPVQLPERCMELLSWKYDIVLDPFMGSGTTAVAAMKKDRNFIGFEISKTYSEIAERRISQVQKELF